MYRCINLGLIVDSSDEFIEPDDIIVDQAIYDIGLSSEGKQIDRQTRRKLARWSTMVDIDGFRHTTDGKASAPKSLTDDDFLFITQPLFDEMTPLLSLNQPKIDAKSRNGQTKYRHYVQSLSRPVSPARRRGRHQ